MQLQANKQVLTAFAFPDNQACFSPLFLKFFWSIWFNELTYVLADVKLNTAIAVFYSYNILEFSLNAGELFDNFRFVSGLHPARTFFAYIIIILVVVSNQLESHVST